MLETNFSENYEAMGLTDEGEGCYLYQDQYSLIKYMQLSTLKDCHDVPTFAIYVKNLDAEVEDGDPLEGFRYIGNVSGSYQFVGNDYLCQTIRDSISAAGQTIFREYPIMNHSLTQFVNEMIIEHPQTIDEVGTIKPQINLSNGYNGMNMAKVSFGFSMYDSNSIDVRNGFTFNQKMVTLKQVHVRTASTIMTGAVSGYIDVFSNNIGDLVRQNFEREISEEDAMKSLEMLEKKGVGKTRVQALTEFLTPIENKTAWNIFHAITRFSTMERNLNAKKLMEDVAESVLVVPAQMTDAIETFNENLAEAA